MRPARKSPRLPHRMPLHFFPLYDNGNASRRTRSVRLHSVFGEPGVSRRPKLLIMKSFLVEKLGLQSRIYVWCWLALLAGASAQAQFTLDREPVGPSSRKTPLVITEIMYNPRAVPGLDTNTTLEFIEVYNSQA